jgi:hypothetical protein
MITRMVKFLFASVFLLILTLPLSVEGFDAETGSKDVAVETETEAEITSSDDEKEPGKFKAFLQARKEKAEADPNRGRFLPIPIFITEPAIGDGLGLALAYFHRSKYAKDEKIVASPGSLNDASKEQAPPPTVTGVMAAYTSNDTKAAGAGHMNSFKDDHIRLTAFAAAADVNSTFYLLDQPFKFNLDGTLAFAETRFRFGDSQWFWGIGLSYLDATTYRYSRRVGLGYPR